ncbi:TonB family protein [Chitinispirillum alkaliphilum]|nr:TonB family protein [Chitinispirillum alkaliphilum]
MKANYLEKPFVIQKTIADYMFPVIAVITMLLFLAAGLHFRKFGLPEKGKDSVVTTPTTAQFLFEETKTQPPVEEKPVVVQEKVVKEKSPPQIIDLTEQPTTPTEIQEPEQSELAEEQKEARPIYGLRRVYSKGIGSGGDMSDAIVGRLGNTLDRSADTSEATEDDIMGRVVSAATVSSAPRVKRQVRPEYTKEMLENRVEGTVRIRVLIDIDGKVKKAELLNDIGFGSGEQALVTIKEMEFFPALRNDEPVAVWIVIPVRFVLLG